MYLQVFMSRIHLVLIRFDAIRMAYDIIFTAEPCLWLNPAMWASVLLSQTVQTPKKSPAQDGSAPWYFGFLSGQSEEACHPSFYRQWYKPVSQSWMFLALRHHHHHSLYTEDQSYDSPKPTAAACGGIQRPCLAKVTQVAAQERLLPSNGILL